MDLFDIHKTISTLLNKAGLGDLIASEKDRLLNLSQKELFAELKPAYGANQVLHDFLLPFESTFTLLNANTTAGVITLPADYATLLSIEVNVVEDGNVQYRGVELVPKDKASERKNSQLIPPSENPFGYIVGKTVQLFPKTPVAGTLHYLRKPVECAIAMSYAGRVETYNEDDTVQLEWNDDAIVKILFKTLAHAGLNLKDDRSIQYAMTREAKA